MWERMVDDIWKQETLHHLHSTQDQVRLKRSRQDHLSRIQQEMDRCLQDIIIPLRRNVPENKPPSFVRWLLRDSQAVALERTEYDVFSKMKIWDQLTVEDQQFLKMEETISSWNQVLQQEYPSNTGKRLKGFYYKTSLFRCQVSSCTGFLQESSFICMVCTAQHCTVCHEPIQETDHVCNPDQVRTIDWITKSTRPCPTCGESISKKQGCDQMFCIQCYTPFSWTTGRILTHSVLHNPHYFERLDRSPEEVQQAHEKLRESKKEESRESTETAAPPPPTLKESTYRVLQNTMFLIYRFEQEHPQNQQYSLLSRFLRKIVEMIDPYLATPRHYAFSEEEYKSSTFQSQRKRYSLGTLKEDEFKRDILRFVRRRYHRYFLQDIFQQSLSRITSLCSQILDQKGFTEECTIDGVFDQFKTILEEGSNAYAYCRQVELPHCRLYKNPHQILLRRLLFSGPSSLLDGYTRCITKKIEYQEFQELHRSLQINAAAATTILDTLRCQVANLYNITTEDFQIKGDSSNQVVFRSPFRYHQVYLAIRKIMEHRFGLCGSLQESLDRRGGRQSLFIFTDEQYEHIMQKHRCHEDIGLAPFSRSMKKGVVVANCLPVVDVGKMATFLKLASPYALTMFTRESYCRMFPLVEIRSPRNRDVTCKFMKKILEFKYGCCGVVSQQESSTSRSSRNHLLFHASERNLKKIGHDFPFLDIVRPL